MTTITRQRVEKKRASVAAPAASAAAPLYSPDATTFFETVLRPEEHSSAAAAEEGILPATLDAIPNSYGSGIPGESTPFDINDFIGGITSELQQRQQGLHNETLLATTHDEPAASLLVELAATNGGTNSNSSSGSSDGTQQQQDDTLDRTFGINSPSSVVSTGPESIGMVLSKTVYEEQLLQHFQLVGAPPVIFAPFDVEWRFVRPAMLALARESTALMNAVCCYADVHKSRLEGRRWTAAPSYYRLASADVQASLMEEDIGGRALEKVFATVFLLMLSEVCKFLFSFSPNVCFA